jgi:hypothetical protein
MSWKQRSLRVVAALALTAMLAGPSVPASAAGFARAGGSGAEVSSLVESLWSWVMSVFCPDPTTTCSGDRGAGLDPNGCGTTGEGAGTAILPQS